MNKIVFVAHNFGVGGAQKVLTEVANLAKENEFTVSLVSLSNIKCIQSVADGIDITYLNYNLHANPLLKICEKVVIIHKLKRYWQECSPDAICVFGLDATMLVQLSAPKNVRILSSERNAPEAYGKINLINSIVRYKKCDLVVFQMEQVRDFYSKYLDIDKCRVIPNAYRERGIEPFRGKRRNVVSCAAARFDYRKGIDTLIKAFSIVVKKHPEYRLIIYGDGDLRGEYEDLIRKLTLENNVQMPGRISNVQQSIREDMVFVLPSRHEGIPNVLLEAMGIGMACVACDCIPGGVNNVTDKGRRAALVKVDDTDQMAEEIIRIIDNEEYRSMLQTNALEIKKEYSESRINDMWINVLYTLVNISKGEHEK